MQFRLHADIDAAGLSGYICARCSWIISGGFYDRDGSDARFTGGCKYRGMCTDVAVFNSL